MLALGSVGITLLAVSLLVFFPSPPLITFIFAVGVVFVILFLVLFSLVGERQPEEEMVSRLEGALEGGMESQRTGEKPDPLSWLKQVSFGGWRAVGEGGIKEEALLGKQGPGEGFFRIWEDEKGRRLALYTLLFPSSREAGDRLQEFLEKLGSWVYETHPERGHFYLEKENIDGAVWRREGTLILLLLGEAGKGEASAFLPSLPETLRP